ncbi:hypothetical protein A8A01_01545 [Ewingella americana]|nr:hypothetical protein A8A01_01545 [Ewingella americana]
MALLTLFHSFNLQRATGEGTRQLADMRTFARHGYFGAMKTQIDHGIFNYCGAPVITSELMHTANPDDIEAHLALAKKLGQKVVATHQHAESLCA